MRLDGVEFLARALRFEGRDYIWGATGPDAFDCSGLVKRVVWEMGGPDWLHSPPWYNAAGLFNLLDPYLAEAKQIGPTHLPVDLEPGTLVFYGAPGGTSKHMHVMIAVGDGRVFGATGGGAQTTKPEEGACVQFRDTVRYRPDVRGFRRLPEVSVRVPSHS